MHKLLSTLAVLCATFTMPAFAEPALLSKDVRIGIAQGVTLDRHGRKGFAKFRKKAAYFGALYIGRDEDSYFYARGYHSAANALSAAKTGCEAIADGTCVLYATAFPAGSDPALRTGPELAGLGSNARKAFTNSYRKRQVEGRYGAFAINGASQMGMSWNWSTREEAEFAALNHCRSDFLAEIAHIGPRALAWAKDNQADACKLIDVFPAGD